MKESEPQRRVVAYVEARPLMSLHDTPERIGRLLQGEVAELQAELQASPEQVSQEHVAAELADCYHYLLLLAHTYEFDLIEALDAKLSLNETRFPADMFQDTSLDFQTVYLDRKRELGEIP